MPIYTPDTILPQGMFAAVTIDGNQTSDVFYADTDAGIVQRYKTDDDGKVILNGDDLATETLHGSVQVTLHPREQ